MADAIPKLLIIWHSRTGGSKAMAEAAASAAKENATVILKSAQSTTPDDLIDADGYIFCAPENLASLSGAMKEFFDRTYYPVLGKIEARPYVTMICAGSDGEGAARQIARIAKGWRLKAVADPIIICTRAQTPAEILASKTIDEDQLARCRDLGTLVATGLLLRIF